MWSTVDAVNGYLSRCTNCQRFKDVGCVHSYRNYFCINFFTAMVHFATGIHIIWIRCRDGLSILLNEMGSMYRIE